MRDDNRKCAGCALNKNNQCIAPELLWHCEATALPTDKDGCLFDDLTFQDAITRGDANVCVSTEEKPL